MWVEAHHQMLEVDDGQWLGGRQDNGGWALLSDADTYLELA